MKRIFNTGYPVSTDLGLLIVRVTVSALMLTHGIPKLLMLLPGSTVHFPAVLGLTPEVSLGLAVFAEVFCSFLLMMGLATRMVTIPLIVTMLVAALWVHAADPLSAKEPALMYLVVYVFLLLSGAGKYSVDGILQQKDSSVATGDLQPQKAEPSFR